MGNDPFKCSPAIVVGNRERVFWGSSVIDGDGDDVTFGDEGVEIVVICGRRGGFDAETSAVEVD